MENRNNYCLILAGGNGRRLWPFSRKDKPKQFLDLFGCGRSLLQQTYDRVARVVPPENIYVSTFKEYYALTCEQLPQLDDEHILAEPVQLSTASAVAWATFHIAHHAPQANMLVTPADQWIVNEDRFVEEIKEGFDFVAAHKDFLALAVKPAFANTGYGYIQKGMDTEVGGYSRVQSFSEKPSKEFACMFLESGEFLWNTGLFLWNAQTMLQRLDEVMPMLASAFRNITESLSLEGEREIVERFYPSNLRLSVDLVILERSRNVYVRECHFGWADLGGWSDFYAVAKKDADDNALLGSQNVMFAGSKGNVVNLPEGTTAVIEGLEDFLVSLNDNVLLVCPTTSDVKRMSDKAKIRFGEELA